ncbi:hypothetical protein XMG7_003240 [Aliiroseovarius sp. xm-g-7]|nr:hypothetical protein [Aliiroseovarius sp. xm-g-7]
MEGVKEELAHQGLAEIAVGQLGQEHVAEIPCVAQEGEVVGGFAFALHFGGIAEPHLGLADEVKRGVGERDVLFENRRVAAPFGHAVAEDQGVVALTQQELQQKGFIDSHYICPTSSGIS